MPSAHPEMRIHCFLLPVVQCLLPLRRLAGLEIGALVVSDLEGFGALAQLPALRRLRLYRVRDLGRPRGTAPLPRATETLRPLGSATCACISLICR